MSSSKKFFGVYRGKVEKNQDPKHLGRITVKVDPVYGFDASGWAWPCTPYASEEGGLAFIPDEGSDVWICFEAGNSEVPIWIGSFWSKKQEFLKESEIPHKKTIKTKYATITIDDKKEIISIENKSKGTIKMDSKGIELDFNGKILKIDDKKISLNGKNLEVY